jgi:Tfp pilus assembly protein PilO
MTNKLIIFISIGVLLCSAAGGVFLWWPKMQSYFSLEQQLVSVDIQLEEKEQYFSKLRETSEKLNSYKDLLSKIDSAFPTDPNVSVPPLIVYMLKVVAESGVSVKGLNIGTDVTESLGNGLSESKFDLSGSAASYAAFKNLINNIYNNARMIDVDSVSLTAPSGQESEASTKEQGAEQSQAAAEYEFSLSLRTNFYLEQNLSQSSAIPGQGTNEPGNLNPPQNQ